MGFVKIPPRLILPLIILVGSLAAAFHMGDAWQIVHSGALFAPPAHAESEEKTKPDAALADQAPAAGEKAEDKKADEANDDDDEEKNTPLYKQLSGRRAQLDKRAAELDSREALIRVAEERVDQKMKELETLRGQLQSLLGQANAAQQTQLENLVKIYETMKPKEAAKIFETLDMPILLGVVQRMKPARTAAVMAEMNPQKAKDITTALTRQNQLPAAP